jgi:tRNA(fMet)-specific endonuclease VapC
MAALFMLDTNIASMALARRSAEVVARLISIPPDQLCVSAVTAGELLFGIARRPDAPRLPQAVTEFLDLIDVRPWTLDTAASYGRLRSALESRGTPMGALDTMIAAHALSLGATIVTQDAGFRRNADLLRVVDWTRPSS